MLGEVQRVESLCRLEICGDFARTKSQYVENKVWRILDVIAESPTTWDNRIIPTSLLYILKKADLRHARLLIH